MRDAATDAHADAASDGPITTTITYAGVFVTRHPGSGGNDNFTATAHAAGDAVAMQVGCGWSTNPPSNVTVTATGWTFVALDTVQGSTDIATEELVVITPDTNPATISVVWDSPCEIGTAVLADEFAGVDVAGGAAAAVGARIWTNGSGNCSASLATGGSAETVWAACFSAFSSAIAGPGYQASADDGGGDTAEYKISNDPAGTVETPTFSNGSEFIEDIILLKPQ